MAMVVGLLVGAYALMNNTKGEAKSSPGLPELAKRVEVLTTRVNQLDTEVANLTKRRAAPDLDSCHWYAKGPNNFSDPKNGSEGGAWPKGGRLDQVACQDDEMLRGWATGLRADEVRYWCCKIKLVPG